MKTLLALALITFAPAAALASGQISLRSGQAVELNGFQVSCNSPAPAPAPTPEETFSVVSCNTYGEDSVRRFTYTLGGKKLEETVISRERSVQDCMTFAGQKQRFIPRKVNVRCVCEGEGGGRFQLTKKLYGPQGMIDEQNLGSGAKSECDQWLKLMLQKDFSCKSPAN